MQKRMHSREFKLDLVRQLATGQKRPAQVCREYGLAESVLSRWRKDYQERGEAAFEPRQADIGRPRLSISFVDIALFATKPSKGARKA